MIPVQPIRRLGDGSSLVRIDPNPTDRRHDTRGFLVGVIAYTHEGRNRPGAGERHRLVSDVTNPDDHPTHAAPLVYHER